MIEVEDNGQLKFSNHRQITPTPRSLFRYSFKDHLKAFNFFLHGEIAVKFRCFLVVSNRGKKFTSWSWEKLMFIVSKNVKTALVFRDLIVKFDSVNFK